MAHDLVIKNEKIIDGFGLPGFHGDVALSRGRPGSKNVPR